MDDRERYDVTHHDPASASGEVVRRLDVWTARRLVEHENNAGRVASMAPTAPRGRGTYR